MTRLVRMDRDPWCEASREFDDYSYLQTWDYGVLLAEKRGAVSEHVGVFEGDDLLALADVRIKRIPVLGGGLAFVSFGPICRNRKRTGEIPLEETLDAIEAEYVARRKMNLRIQPQLFPDEDSRRIEKIFLRRGFQTVDEARPYRTFLVDLTPPLEEIRACLSRRWRRHLNQAERQSIEVVVGTGVEALGEMVEFHRDFILRKGFSTELDAGFFQRVQSALPEAERFHVFRARVEGRLAAGAVMSLLGDSMVYLLGGRNEAGSRTRASYLLHWKALCMAKDRGFKWYDLGGVDPDENPGVHTFKEGMGGVERRALGPYEKASNSPFAGMLNTLEKLYRLTRRLRRS